MILNYLKITLKVLGRNKFFTFVSLFGIVFTLLILIVLSAFLDHLIAPHYPDVNRGRCLYVGMVDMGNPDEGSHKMGPPSYHFLEKYVKPLKTPKLVGVSSMPSFANTYVGNRRLKLNLKFTDPEFWEITAFDFLEGKPYSQQNLDNGDNVAVINARTRDNYFGEGAQVVGKSIEVENVAYRVIGVVKDVPVTRLIVAGDVYLPYTVARSQAKSPSMSGNYFGILLADSPSDFTAIKEEFRHVIAQVPMPMDDEGFTFGELRVEAQSYLEYFLNIGLIDVGSTGTFYTIIGIFMLLFMLLPAINLVNLNMSRIMERSSEIGIRKAFGASIGRLAGQFIIENVFITLLGGVVAVLLSLIFIRIFNESGLIPGADLAVNIQVLLVGLGACLAFGLLSGVIPAIRMSRMNVVDALRGGEVDS
ncbi:MAG: ABC transporter permease [Phaeodactylibacter sp.]|nr:ABC transporter permease [Phaeodactylibacter sp.]MCB9276555.1 ABC transporter permease [Lewinellaceae bacterium]